MKLLHYIRYCFDAKYRRKYDKAMRFQRIMAINREIKGEAR